MDAGVSPDSVKMRGIDVSHFQGSIDWSLVAKEEVAFAFIKATEGTSWVDPQFHANWNGAHAAGLLRGAYHFYEPDADPHQQALSFMSIVQTRPGDLPPVLDVELPKEPSKISPSEIVSGIQVWLAAVEQGTGKVPILYTNPSFWAKLGAATFRCGLRSTEWTHRKFLRGGRRGPSGSTPSRERSRESKGPSTSIYSRALSCGEEKWCSQEESNPQPTDP